MADVAKKPRNSRKALKEKNSVAVESPVMLPSKTGDLATEKNDAAVLTSPAKAKSGGGAAAKKRQQKASTAASPAAPSSFEQELEEMQERLRQLKIEKEKTEELLKEKDEMLRIKDEQQEKLQAEFKKLQKLKEFKPTMTFPIFQSMKDKEQQDKKEKKKGCPEKKRPSPPYILWCKEQWNLIKKENPEAEFKEISNILGAKWKEVTAEEKKPYEEKYEAEKETYLQVMAKEKREAEAMKLFEDEHKQKTAMELLDQYLQFKQEAAKEETKKSKKEKDPLKPKQPISAFFVFTNERRAALLAEGKSVLEVSKITGEEWKNMSDVQKAPYEEISKKNKEKYMQEMEIYKQKKQEEAESLKKGEEEQMKLQKQEALQLLKKKEKTDNIIKKTKENRQKKKKKIVDPNKPKKPASSYLLFCKEARKSILEEVPAGTNNNTISAMLSVRWRELSEEDRKVWDEKAGEAMEVYKKELEAYNKTVVNASEAKVEEEEEEEE